MSEWQRISVEELEKLTMQTNMLVLDIRDTRSYLQGHFPRALHLDESNLRSILKNTSRDLPILIYCYQGNSSEDMAQLFADFGFTRCYSLEGGYDAWFQHLEQGWYPQESIASLQQAQI